VISAVRCAAGAAAAAARGTVSAAYTGGGFAATLLALPLFTVKHASAVREALFVPAVRQTPSRLSVERGVFVS
jgi:hypothetical protein